MQSAQSGRGFGLIELMVAVAIVAVLAAIAVPVYQRYVARSLIASALEEVAPARTPYELLISQSPDASDYTDVARLGLKADTPRCTVTATAPVDGAGYIQCVIKGNGMVAGRSIRWQRSDTEGWSCESSDIDPGLLPGACNHP